MTLLLSLISYGKMWLVIIMFFVMWRGGEGRGAYEPFSFKHSHYFDSWTIQQPHYYSDICEPLPSSSKRMSTSVSPLPEFVNRSD